MISDDFDFLSPKYTLISFLSIGNAYFSFILLFSILNLYSFLQTLRNISRIKHYITSTDLCVPSKVVCLYQLVKIFVYQIKLFVYRELTKDRPGQVVCLVT